ncbi:MAG: tetratricopeptide repeat protein [Candidatus Kapaibacterium sp.]
MKIITVILTLFLALNVSSQETPSEYIKKANKYLFNKDYDEALELFQYVVENFPNNKAYSNALLNIGYIHFIQEDYDEAIEIFEEVLNLKPEEDIKLNGYSYLKHDACAMMSDIYYEEGEYESSLYYLSLSDTTYPYRGMCGNGNVEIGIQRALRYSELYLELDNETKAIEALMDYAFTDLANNDEILEELEELLDGKKNLVEKFDAAVNDMYPKAFDRDGDKFKMYYFKFLDAEIWVPNSYEGGTRTFDKLNGMKVMKSSSFYQMISELDKP